MPPVGFEPTVSVDKRPQTYALERAATETGYWRPYYKTKIINNQINRESSLRKISAGHLLKWTEGKN